MNYKKSSGGFFVALLLALTLPMLLTAPGLMAEEKKALFAGGCFWCMEQAFDSVEGVTQTLSGYTGGKLKDPSYNQVGSGDTGHREALLIYYDDRKVNYKQLLKVFWENIDPLDDGGQFCDRGEPYKTAVFYLDKEQKVLAETSKQELIDSKVLEGKPLTPIIKGSQFYLAEEYHQDYYIRHPLKYTYYKYGCRRPQRLKELWGEKDEAPA